IERNLVVSASSGVQFPTGRSDACDQALLDRKMDIFMLVAKFKNTRFNILLDLIETGNDQLTFFLRNDFTPSEHTGMRNATGNILVIEFPIQADRRGKFMRELG